MPTEIPFQWRALYSSLEKSMCMNHVFRILSIALFMVQGTMAQSMDRHVAASSGNEYSTSVGSMAYTIGEPLTNTLVGGTATFTQGFHQGTIA